MLHVCEGNYLLILELTQAEMKTIVSEMPVVSADRLKAAGGI